MDQATPREFAGGQLSVLRARWTGMLDGDVESVHDARVATRRLRAALPFVAGVPPTARKRFKRIGRALGRVRDLDVTHELLGTLQRRVPAADIALALLRRDIDEQQMTARRRLMKTLNGDPRSLAHAITGLGMRRGAASIWPAWRHALREHVVARACGVLEATDRATAVYMPTRTHRVRIALKKLRYAVEVGVAGGAMRDAELLAVMKAEQETLGELHDLQVVADTIEAFAFPSKAARRAAQLLAAAVDVEVGRLHDKYVRHRERIRGVSLAALRAARAADRRSLVRRAARMLPVAGIAAADIAAWYIGSAESRADAAEPARDVADSAARRSVVLPAPA